MRQTRRRQINTKSKHHTIINNAADAPAAGHGTPDHVVWCLLFVLMRQRQDMEPLTMCEKRERTEKMQKALISRGTLRQVRGLRA